MSLIGFIASKMARTPAEDGALVPGALPELPPHAPARRNKRGYYTAAGTGRLHAGQRTIGAGPNAVTIDDLAVLRARMRGAVRNSGFARKAVSVLVNAFVGQGIRPQSLTGDAALDARVDALWAEWAVIADADDRGDVYWLQRQAVRAWIESGEVFLRRRSRPLGPGARVPVEVQAIESDLLPLYDVQGKARKAETVALGVVFDRRMKRTAYLMYRHHPGDSTGWRHVTPADLVRVPARDISHVYDAERPGQIRGVPWGSCVLEDLVALDEYMANEAARQEAQSGITAFVRGVDPEVSPGIGSVEQNTATGDYEDVIETGTIRHLNYGEDVEFAVPHVSPQLDAYSKVILRKVATGWRIPYELLTADLSGVNFSSIRTGMLEFERMWQGAQRHVVIPHVCDPMWRWFIAGAIAAGELPARAGGYPVEWHAPRPVPIDRIKAAKADEAEIANLLSSRGDIIRARGKDPAKVWAAAAADKAALESLGLMPLDNGADSGNMTA